MSLDLKKLEQARELANGVIQARCPACAKNESDKTGDHLRVYPDGRFGCCVHPKDREHRKQIFALVGEHVRRSFQVRVAACKQAPSPFLSVTASLTNFVRTLRTPVCESVQESPISSAEVRTLRTPISNPHAYIKKEGTYIDACAHTYKDCKSAVLTVLSSPSGEKLPFLLADGTLSIPFDSPERYHWWKSGQSVTQTRHEILERS